MELAADGIEAREAESNEALIQLFDFDEDGNVAPDDSDRWIIPTDKEDRLKNYLKAELALQSALVEKAKPGYDTKAQTEELVYQNALTFMDGESDNYGPFEDALKKVYKSIRLLEKDHADQYANAGASTVQERREYNYLLTCKMMIVDFAEQIVGHGSGKRIKQEEVAV